MKHVKPGRGPSAMGAFGAIIAVIFGIFWTVSTASMGAPAFFPIFGVLFIIIGIVQAVYNFKNATGKTPFFIGKPEPIMVNCALKQLSASPDDAVLIGDRLYTDIAAGKNAGVDTICVLSGEAALEEALSGEIRPTWIFDGVKQICEALSQP